MVIHEMSREECLQLLAVSRVARLACAHENQPYVVPIYFTFHQESLGEPYLYGFTTLGQKVAWMRTNPLVCIEIDDVTSYDQWVSVIAFGRYEELPAATQTNGSSSQTLETPLEVGETPLARPGDSKLRNDQEEQAWQILKAHPMWQEPGSTAWAARVHRDSSEAFTAIYYRICIDRLTGHKATRNANATNSNAMPASTLRGWIYRTVTRMFGSGSKKADSTA